MDRFRPAAFSCIASHQSPVTGSRIPSPETGVPNPESRVPSPASRVPSPSPESRIPSPDPESRIPNPNPESRIRTYADRVSTRQISLDTIRDAASAVYRRGGPHAARPARAARARGAGPGDLPQARNAAADRIVQDSRRAQRRQPADAGASLPDGVWTVSAGNAAQGVALAARHAGAPLQRDGDGHRARDQAARHRAARRDDRHAPPTTSAGGRSKQHASRSHGAATSSIRSTTTSSSPATATVGLEILEDLPDVDAVVAPLGGGGLLAGIGGAMQRAAARRARLRRGAGNRRAARRVARAPGRPAASTVAGVVRRRRRRQVGAADDVAAAAARGSTGRSSCRSTRRPRRCASSPSGRT